MTFIASYESTWGFFMPLPGPTSWAFPTAHCSSPVSRLLRKGKERFDLGNKANYTATLRHHWSVICMRRRTKFWKWSWFYFRDQWPLNFTRSRLTLCLVIRSHVQHLPKMKKFRGERLQHVLCDSNLCKARLWCPIIYFWYLYSRLPLNPYPQ